MKTLFSSALFGTVALSGAVQASLPENPLPVAVYSLPGSDFSTLGRGHVTTRISVTASQYATIMTAPARD